VILIILLIGAVPTWPYSRDWSFIPSGTVGMIVVVVVLLILTRQL